MIQVRPVDIVIGDCEAQVCKCRNHIQRLCINTNCYPAGLEEVLQRHTYDTEFLPETEFFGLIIPVSKAPWWYLNPAPLAFGKHGGVLLQYMENVTPVLAVKMVPQAVPDTQGPREVGKGVWALRHVLWETDVKYLQNVLRLTDLQPVPVNFRICPCIRRLCAVIKPELSSTMKSGQGICLLNRL